MVHGTSVPELADTEELIGFSTQPVVLTNMVRLDQTGHTRSPIQDVS